jgi:hypothetical protein
MPVTTIRKYSRHLQKNSRASGAPLQACHAIRGYSHGFALTRPPNQRACAPRSNFREDKNNGYHGNFFSRLRPVVGFRRQSQQYDRHQSRRGRTHPDQRRYGTHRWRYGDRRQHLSDPGVRRRGQRHDFARRNQRRAAQRPVVRRRRQRHVDRRVGQRSRRQAIRWRSTRAPATTRSTPPALHPGSSASLSMEAPATIPSRGVRATMCSSAATATTP